MSHTYDRKLTAILSTFSKFKDELAHALSIHQNTLNSMFTNILTGKYSLADRHYAIIARKCA
jgi:hypothetical protein